MFVPLSAAILFSCGKATACGALPAYLIRTARYTLIILVIIGVYPEAFPLSERIGKKKQPEKAVNGNRRC